VAEGWGARTPQTEYWKVMLLDMDTLLVGRMDELLEKSTPILFTVSGGNTNEGLQGGMIVVRPDVASYNAILEVVREGDFHYDGGGWAGSGIGYSYGGETIQGVLPYYYAKKAPPGSHQIVSCSAFRGRRRRIEQEWASSGHWGLPAACCDPPNATSFQTRRLLRGGARVSGRASALTWGAGRCLAVHRLSLCGSPPSDDCLLHSLMSPRKRVLPPLAACASGRWTTACTTTWATRSRASTCPWAQ